MTWFANIRFASKRFGRKHQSIRRGQAAPCMFGGEWLEDRRLLAFDPSPDEQALMEHLNRLRTEPQNELALYFESINPLQVRDDGRLAEIFGLQAIQDAVDHFAVNGTVLQQQFSQLTAVPPLAWHEFLITGAELHNGFMHTANEQSHQLPGEESLGDRLVDAGYNLTLALENVYAFSEEDALYGHAAFSIDWGGPTGGTGIQDPPGHRNNFMNGEVTEVGIAILEVDVPAPNSDDVGPWLITQDFGRRNGYQAQLLGVVFEDGFREDNPPSLGVGLTGIYDPGEGFNQVTITAQGNGQIYTTTSMSAGGYQMVVPPGTYTVTVKGTSAFSPFPLERAYANVVMGAVNKKMDFEARDVNATATRRAAAVADNAVVNENQSVAITVAGNDTDADGTINAATVQIWTQPGHGTVSVAANGVVTYTPSAGFSGTDSFKYVVADNTGAFSAPADVNVTINDVNSAPVATNSSFTASVGTATPHDVTTNVSDSDGTVNWASLEITQNPTSGTVLFNSTTHTFSYTANSGASGSDSFRYRVADNSGSFSNIAIVSVTISAVNVAPVAVNDRVAAIPGLAKTLNVTANDTDVDSTLSSGSVAISSAPTNGTATVTGVAISYTANAAYRGIDTLRYRVSDGEGGTSGEATVTIYVVDPDKPWTNPVLAYDVDPNGSVSPLDAIIVINNLGLTLVGTSMPIPDFPDAPPPFMDVNDNGAVDPLDAILVINNFGLTTAARAPLSASSSRTIIMTSETVAEQESTPTTMLPTTELPTTELPATVMPTIRAATAGGAFTRVNDFIVSDARSIDATVVRTQRLMQRAVARRGGMIGSADASGESADMSVRPLSESGLSVVDQALSRLYR